MTDANSKYLYEELNRRKDLLINMYEFQIEEALDKIEELEATK